MKRLRIISVAASVVLALCLTACSSEPLEGEDLVLAAREKYESYDSAKVVITNEATGEVEQEFTFKYDEKDSLTYLYTGGYEGENYIQYNNGFECYTEQSGEFSFTQRGDSDFEAYTRDSKHPQASGAYLPFERGAINNTEKETDADGGKTYSYSYDPDSFETEAGIVSFKAIYHFNKSGDLLYFEEISVMKNNDKSETEHSYRIDIEDINSVGEIENPLKDKANEKNS